ncbi:MAG: MarR family transcriptional regulator [Anaerolineae bacterium]
MESSQNLSESIVRRLLSLVRYSHRFGHRLQREYGVSGRRLSVLRYLADEGEHSLSDISRYLDLRDGTTSPLLDSMAQAGLVSRRRCTDDCRRVLFQVSEEGRTLVDSAPLTVFARLRKYLPDLSPEELSAIDAALARINTVAELEESLLE